MTVEKRMIIPKGQSRDKGILCGALLLTILFTGTSSQAQNVSGRSTVSAKQRPSVVTWERHYGNREFGNFLGVARAPDGGWLLAGATRQFGTQDMDGWAVRIDQRGQPLWARTYGGPEKDFLKSAAWEKGGGWILGGWRAPAAALRWQPRAWALRIDALGDMVWQRSFGEGGQNWIEAVVVAPDSDFLLFVGTHQEGGSGFGWGVRVGSSGETLWERLFGGTENLDYFYGGAAAPHNGWLLLGKTGFFAPAAWAVRVDLGGEKKWERKIGAGESSFKAVLAISGGGWLLIGSTMSKTGGNREGWVLRVDADGRFVWERSFTCEANCFFDAAAPRAAGGWMVVGTTSSKNGTSAGWAVRLDANGDRLWHRRFDRASFSAVAQGSAGGWVLVGMRDSAGFAVRIED